MARRMDGRVEPGEKVSEAFSARAWNRAQQAADQVLGTTAGYDAGENTPGARASNYIHLRNDSGQIVPVLGVLKIGTPLALDTQKPAQFGANPVMAGLMPDGLTPFAVAVEPVQVNAVGRFAIGGRFACKVKVVDASHQYARSRLNDVTQLISASCGPVRLLWNQGVGDDKFAVGML